MGKDHAAIPNHLSGIMQNRKASWLHLRVLSKASTSDSLSFETQQTPANLLLLILMANEMKNAVHI
jgi:hypothetical protein